MFILVLPPRILKGSAGLYCPKKYFGLFRQEGKRARGECHFYFLTLWLRRTTSPQSSGSQVAPRENYARIQATGRGSPGLGLLTPLSAPGSALPTTHPEDIFPRPDLPGPLPPSQPRGPAPATLPTPVPGPPLPHVTLRPRSRRPTPPLPHLLSEGCARAAGDHPLAPQPAQLANLHPGPGAPWWAARTHLEELGRRSHPGRLRGSPRAGRRLYFTCCASAAPRTGPCSARQLRPGTPRAPRLPTEPRRGWTAAMKRSRRRLSAASRRRPRCSHCHRLVRRKWSCARGRGGREGQTGETNCRQTAEARRTGEWGSLVLAGHHPGNGI